MPASSRWTLIVLAVALGAALSRSANAQTAAGNMFAGAGTFKCCQGKTSAWQVGGSAEVPVTSGISLGGELGLVGPMGDGKVFEPSGYVMFGHTLLLSVNGWYHVNLLDAQRLRPFLTGGIGRTLEHGDSVGGPNFGGGIDWWLRKRRGVRVEVRDQLLGEFGTTHLVTVRVGLILR